MEAISGTRAYFCSELPGGEPPRRFMQCLPLTDGADAAALSDGPANQPTPVRGRRRVSLKFVPLFGWTLSSAGGDAGRAQSLGSHFDAAGELLALGPVFDAAGRIIGRPVGGFLYIKKWRDDLMGGNTRIDNLAMGAGLLIRLDDLGICDDLELLFGGGLRRREITSPSIAVQSSSVIVSRGEDFGIGVRGRW